MLSGKRLENYKKFQAALDSSPEAFESLSHDPENLFCHLIPSLKILLKNKNTLMVKLSIQGRSDNDIFDLFLLNSKDKVLESYCGRGYQDLISLLNESLD
jgi:hypothetical protein